MTLRNTSTRLLVALFVLSLALPAATLSLQTLPASQFGGYYVGPAGSNFGPVVCVSYDIITSIPSAFEVQLVEIISPVQMQVAYLYDKMMDILPADVGDLQFAIWKLYNPTFSQQTAKSLAYVAEAQAAQLTPDMFSGLRLFVPTTTRNQTFIGQVPEPGTWAMLAAGLLGLGMLRRRKA